MLRGMNARAARSRSDVSRHGPTCDMVVRLPRGMDAHE